MPNIFISYRREDSAGYAGRLYDRLSTHFGAASVFMDIDTIEPGIDFVAVIEEAISGCDILVVVIGKRWLSIMDATEQRRLDNPDDFVRLEVQTGLERERRVIPVLVGGATMPSARDLPEALAKLARRHALELSDTRWHADVGKLIEIVEKISEAAQRRAEEERRQREAEATQRRVEEERRQREAEATQRRVEEERRQREAEATQRRAEEMDVENEKQSFNASPEDRATDDKRTKLQSNNLQVSSAELSSLPSGTNTYVDMLSSKQSYQTILGVHLTNTHLIGLGILVIVLIIILGTLSALHTVNTTTVSIGDTWWVLTSSFLILLTVVGFTLFYGGLVNHENVLGAFGQSSVLLGVICVYWALGGYSIAFGPDIGGLLGDVKYYALANVGLEPGPYSSTISHLLYMVYQGLFAVIPIVIFSVFAEQMKFTTFIIFSFLWAVSVFSPTMHWVWGKGGWLGALGMLDFAGGTVIHISTGASVLVSTILLKKKPFLTKSVKSLFLKEIGAAFLWIGWFGINAGSALAADGLAANAFVTTNTATAAAVLAWLSLEWRYSGTPTVFGTVTGIVVGLVAITPGAGFVTPISSIIIGATAGIVCYYVIRLQRYFSYHEAFVVVVLHGVAGTWGMLATGLFASTAVNSSGANGLFFGDSTLILRQLVSIVVIWFYAAIMTWIILRILDATIGLHIRAD